MDFLQSLRDRLSENETELESIQERVRLLSEKNEALKTLIAAEEADIKSSGNKPPAVRRQAVSGLTLSKSDDVPSATAIPLGKSTQMARILEENRRRGISSSDIMETLKQRNVDIDSSYVYSYLSRNKAKGLLTYKDGKYCLVESN